MDIDKQQIMQTVLRITHHISDKEYQKKAWIQGEEADFDEVICLFFGDGDPILEHYKDFEITDAQYTILKKFRDAFRLFADANDFPEAFINTPEWERITLMAKEVLQAFNYIPQ